jgi:hypothetical protein
MWRSKGFSKYQFYKQFLVGIDNSHQTATTPKSMFQTSPNHSDGQNLNIKIGTSLSKMFEILNIWERQEQINLNFPEEVKNRLNSRLHASCLKT